MIKPIIHESSWVAKNATVLGDVKIAENCSVWFNAVIRTESEPITISKGVNIQDNCTLHTGVGYPITLGENITIGHNCIIHGCTIGDNCLIGMGAIIMNGASIGKNCIIGAGALILERTVIPDNSVVVGNPGKVIKQCGEKQLALIQFSANHYIEEYKMFKEENL